MKKKLKQLYKNVMHKYSTSSNVIKRDHKLEAKVGSVYVFIRSWNRPLYLWACLDSLYRNTYYPCHFILIDNNSNDPQVREIVSGFQKRNLFHAIYFMSQNHPANQNMIFFSEIFNLTHCKVLFEFEKYYLPLHINSSEIAWRFQTQSLPIVGVYYLCRSTDERVKVECISQQNRLIDLTRNVYGYYLSNNNVCDFKILGELITKIPAYRFFYPHKLEILPQIFANILEHSTNSLPHPS